VGDEGETVDAEQPLEIPGGELEGLIDASRAIREPETQMMGLAGKLVHSSGVRKHAQWVLYGSSLVGPHLQLVLAY
jgi:hypothetical protein